MKNTLMAACLGMALYLPVGANAQGFLKKLKDKVEKKAEDLVDKKANTATQNNSSTTTAVIPSSSSTGNSTATTVSTNRPVNKAGAGLSNTTPPDVLAQMDEADAAGKEKDYSSARYSIQQAMQGIEIQLGRSILRSLPVTVNTLPADTTQDKVMSTQWGWSNLAMQRVYRMDDQQLTITIGSNQAYAGMMDLYFANAAMIEASAEKQNIKQVRVKGNKALIQYDERKGYTLMMQLGQSALIVWECINFTTEQEVMNAANSFNIDSIKKQLGEQ